MTYYALNSEVLHGTARLEVRSRAVIARKCGPEDPAVLAFTDFHFTPAVTVATGFPIVYALDTMTRAGIGALLVERSGYVVGLIRTSDIQQVRRSETISAFGSVVEGGEHLHFKVEDVMSPLDRTPAVHIDALLSCRMGDVLKTFECHEDWTHILVIQHSDEGAITIRGIVTKARVVDLLTPSMTGPT